MKINALNIPQEEFNRRLAHLVDNLGRQSLIGAVIFDRYYVLYYTGFAFIPTERPVALVVNAAGEKALFVPRLELEHAESLALVDRVVSYIEYPYIPHPMEVLKTLLKDLGVRMVVICTGCNGNWSNIKPLVNGNNWDFETSFQRRTQFPRLEPGKVRSCR